MKKVPVTDMDFVELIAEKLKNDPKIFKNHKDFIEGQMFMSQSFFKRYFKEDNFKEQAREYLKGMRLIQ